jgi:hypothetical protein
LQDIHLLGEITEAGFKIYGCIKFAFAGVDLVKVDKSESKMYLLDGDNIVKEYHVVLL